MLINLSNIQRKKEKNNLWSRNPNNKSGWIVDAFTQIDPEFKFDYYPTQYDQHNVHVFLNEDNAYTSVRLVPRHTFLDKDYTDKEIENNSFEHLKQINTIASLRPKWPVIHLQSLEKNEFINAIKDIETPFVWTVDPDVKVNQSLLDSGYLPTITQTNKVPSNTRACWIVIASFPSPSASSFRCLTKLASSELNLLLISLSSKGW